MAEKWIMLRLPAVDLKQWPQDAGSQDNKTSLNRLLANHVLEIICLALSEPFAVPEEASFLKRPLLEKHTFLALSERDIRRPLPNTETRPFRLTFQSQDRERLVLLARRLRWTKGQLALEALQTYCLCASGVLSEIPDLLRLYRAERTFVTGGRETADEILGCLNSAILTASAVYSALQSEHQVIAPFDEQNLRDIFGE